MKQKGNFRYVGISYFLVLFIVICLVGSCSAGGGKPIEEEPVEEEKGTDTVITVVDENSIQKPTWMVGDSWCMGYTIDFSEMEDEMRSDLDSSMSKIKRLDVRGEIGVYQSAKVLKDDVLVKIDDTDYTCYKVYFEQYMGGAFTIDYDIEMEIPDFFSSEEDEYYYGDFRSSSKSSYETTTARMKSYTYMKIKGDVVGYIYYTVDDLAIAKGSFDQQLDGEVEMDLDARMGGQTYMDMATEFHLLNVRSEYDVEYNPPLDIFNFPIEPNEYWSASSMMTTTLNKISGRITYDISMTGTDYPDTSMKDDLDLNREISTPDSYGPVRVTHYFYNPGTKSINLLEGIKSECIIIEPDEDYWYHDYEEYDYEDSTWDDTDSDGYVNDLEEYGYEESSTSIISSSIPYGGPDTNDFNAESLESPIETSANSINYYSEDKGNIISYEPPDESSSSITSVPYSSSEGEYTAEPKTYSQVTTFKTEDRENYLTKYSRSSGGGGVEDDSTWTLIIASITIAFLVFIVVIAAMRIAKKKRVQQMTQNYSPPSQAGGSQPQDPYSQSPSYSSPPSHQLPVQPSPQQLQNYGSYDTYRTQGQYPTRTDYQPPTPTRPQQPYGQQSTYQSQNYPDYNEPYDPRPKYDYNPSEYNYNPYNRNRNY